MTAELLARTTPADRGGDDLRRIVRVGRGSGPGIIVGTPRPRHGHAQRDHLPYDRRTRIAVLDEVDRMLDIGFRDDIRAILGGLLDEASQT